MRAKNQLATGKAPTDSLSRVKRSSTPIGFIIPGSLVVRETLCAKPGCRCQGDPPQRHGPYFQWSRTRDGKTESRRLDEHEVELYREWIDNRRRLEWIIDQMEYVSESANDILLRRARSEGH